MLARKYTGGTMEYWSDAKDRLPDLFAVARIVYAIPAHVCGCERAFPTLGALSILVPRMRFLAGRIYECHSANLSPKIAELELSTRELLQPHRLTNGGTCGYKFEELRNREKRNFFRYLKDLPVAEVQRIVNDFLAGDDSQPLVIDVEQHVSGAIINFLLFQHPYCMALEEGGAGHGESTAENIERNIPEHSDGELSE